MLLALAPWGQIRGLLGGRSEEGSLPQSPYLGPWGGSAAPPDFSFSCPSSESILVDSLPCHTPSAFSPREWNSEPLPPTSQADTRSMIFKWFPLVSCDWQLIKWMIQCFYPGDCSAGLGGVSDGRGRGGSLWTPRWGTFCASVGSLSGPFPSKLGWPDRRPHLPTHGP